MTINTNKIQKPDGSPVELTAQNAGKVWANLYAEGATPSLRDGLNVSSVTDHGTGQHTFNFTNNLADANYGFFFSGGIGSSGAGSRDISNATTNPTTSAIRMISEDRTGGDDDLKYVTLLVHGDLA